MKDGNPEEDTSSRKRTMTDKGLQYTKGLKEKERNRLLVNLDSHTEILEDLLGESSDILVAKQNYSEWLNSYEALLMAHDEYQRLLSSQEASLDHEHFEKVSFKYIRMKHTAEEWFLMYAKPLSPILQQDIDAKSHSSLSSKTSRVSSHISIEKLKEGQRKVELIARQAALKEKQKIQEEKLRLNLKEEELDLATELKVSDAKTRILDELEKSMRQDTHINFETAKEVNYETKLKKLTLAPSHNKYEHSVVDKNRTSNSNNDISAISRELNKPKAEIQKFGGNVLDYKHFLRQFEARVCANTDSYDEKLTFLLQFTFGEAHKIVLGYSNLPAEIGYKAVCEEFNERYGEPDLIAQAYVKKVMEWPLIKADNAKALDEFAIFLRECQYAVENVEAAGVLEYSENLKAIIKKLPYYLHEKWRNMVYEIKAKKGFVKFEHLVTLVRKEAKKATDPVYGRDILNNQNTDKKSSKPLNHRTTPNYNNNGKAFVTNVTENNPVKYGVAFTKPCIYCAGQHSLDTCENVTKLTLTERYTFLKSKGLCFGCLKSGHYKGDCRRKSTCEQCKNYHPNILHVNAYKVNSSYAVHTRAGAG